MLAGSMMSLLRYTSWCGVKLLSLTIIGQSLEVTICHRALDSYLYSIGSFKQWGDNFCKLGRFKHIEKESEKGFKNLKSNVTMSKKPRAKRVKLIRQITEW